jgi:hypothetical protein
MGFAVLIYLVIALGTTIGSPVTSDSLYQDFDSSENSYLVPSQDDSLFSSDLGDLTPISSQPLGSDDFPLLAFNDPPSLEISDQILPSLDDILFGLNPPSCTLGKRDGAACSASQDHIELPDISQIGKTTIKENPLLAPIVIVDGDGASDKCANPLYPLNLCCGGPLGGLAEGYSRLMVFVTVDNCKPGKWRGVFQ